MRIRPYFVLALLCSSLCFSGCFEFYYDIVQNPNGTFRIRQTIGFGNEFFQELASFSGMGDSVKVTPSMIQDSIRHTFSLRRDSLIQIEHIIGMSGISSFEFHDTTVDSITYFTLEAAVTNVDSLPGAFHRMANTTSAIGPASNDQSDSDDVRLKVAHTKARTSLTLYAPPKEGGFMKLDMPGMEEAFTGLSMHYRVFSTALEHPHDKHIKPFPGGQERVFDINDLTRKGRKAHLDATFVVKNPVAQH
jgi:hypothetical protein